MKLTAALLVLCEPSQTLARGAVTVLTCSEQSSSRPRGTVPMAQQAAIRSCRIADARTGPGSVEPLLVAPHSQLLWSFVLERN
jgi:hypothetical protein